MIHSLLKWAAFRYRIKGSVTEIVRQDAAVLNRRPFAVVPKLIGIPLWPRHASQRANRADPRSSISRTIDVNAIERQTARVQRVFSRGSNRKEHRMVESQ